MRRLLLVTLLALAGSLVLASNALAGEDTPITEGEALCLPGVYPVPQSHCSPLGPSEYLTRMAEKGITFPFRNLFAESPDPELAQVPYYYARVNEPDAPVYPSLDAAIAGEPVRRTIRTGYDFVSYITYEVVDGKKYYMLGPGEWMRSGHLSSGVIPPNFQGITFSQNPERPFGWILYPVETKGSPGYQNSDYSGHWLNRYDIVQIYETTEVEGLEWYLVGPDEWVDQRLIGRVIPDTTPPEGITNERWIAIDLFEQTLMVYEYGQLIFATLISSGVEPYWTRPGLFQIERKLESTPMRGAFTADWSDYYYLEDVPWTMYFDEARALHGAYWHNGFGYARSHGCVNLGPGDALWLYNWARIGDWVYVWDPSGRTPEDPSLYTPGGA